jgi:hypothetical protein
MLPINASWVWGEMLDNIIILVNIS